MTIQETETVDVNGVTIELPGRRAVANYHMRIGDRVKVLVTSYSGAEVHPGVIVGFEPFKELPTIVVAYATNNFSSSDIKFLYFNSKSKEEMVIAADDEFMTDKDKILAGFDREIAKKQAEIDVILEKRRYFETNFKQYWDKVR